MPVSAGTSLLALDFLPELLRRYAVDLLQRLEGAQDLGVARPVEVAGSRLPDPDDVQEGFLDHGPAKGMQRKHQAIRPPSQLDQHGAERAI